ncbi:hypothetical protein GCM10011297_08740 [Bacterioplanes sanyensis]|uniref:cell division protein FtsQ/DivIB n=1 Tax=Bacterioplanes sanyensis TaxID=1249553 RepID=UPI001677C118|nr:FtsQ-type POTRA domain-containing protein [Bacterioplanes sanyensis]GGY37848.1 hypothetical protein GCM10011297_08740 [Bacterioplanes sanyensis]
MAERRWLKRKPPAPKRGATPLEKPRAKRLRLPAMPAVKVPWRALFLVSVAVLVVAALQFSYRHWPITDVVVEGRMAVHSAEDIARRLLWLKQESFFSADLHRVQQQIEQLPLVAGVVVSKQWPSGITVNVRESVPVARWNENSLLDSSGRVTERPAVFDASELPHIKAQSRYADVASRSYRLVQQILLSRQVTVEHLSVSSSGSIHAQLSNGWSVALGKGYIEQRLQRLARLLDTLPAQQVARLDLRYGKGAAIGWRQGEKG